MKNIQEECILCGSKFHIPCVFEPLPSDHSQCFCFLHYKCNKCGDISIIDRARIALSQNDMTDVKNKIVTVVKDHSNNKKKLVILSDDSLKNEWKTYFKEKWEKVNGNTERPTELLTISEIIEYYDKFLKKSK